MSEESAWAKVDALTDTLTKAAERLMVDSGWWRDQIRGDTDPATARLYEGRSEGLRWGAAAIIDALPEPSPARADRERHDGGQA